MKLDLIEAGTPKLYATTVPGTVHYYSGGVNGARRDGVFAFPCLVLAKGKFRSSFNPCGPNTIVEAPFSGTPQSVIIARPAAWESHRTQSPYKFDLTEVWPNMAALKWPWVVDMVAPAKIWDWDEFLAKRDERVEAAREISFQKERLTVVQKESEAEFVRQIKVLATDKPEVLGAMLRDIHGVTVATYNDHHSYTFRVDLDINATDLTPDLVALFKERSALAKRLEECRIR